MVHGNIANTHIASDDFVVLGVLDDLFDLLDCAINIAADTSDLDDVLGRRIANLGTELDGQGLVLANDTVKPVSLVFLFIQVSRLRVESSAVASNNRFVPLLLHKNVLRFDVCSIFRPLQKLLLHFIELLCLIQG